MQNNKNRKTQWLRQPEQKENDHKTERTLEMAATAGQCHVTTQ